MDIKLITLGKIKENYLKDAISEYSKRISAFCNLKIIELKEYNENEATDLEKEKVLILKEISDNDYVVTLEIEGKMLDSVDFSSFVCNHHTYNNKNLCFIIGSSCGLINDVKKRSDYKISFSKMTFPHQLMRVIFLEQLYRAFMIGQNRKYHK